MKTLGKKEEKKVTAEKIFSKELFLLCGCRLGKNSRRNGGSGFSELDSIDVRVNSRHQPYVLHYIPGLDWEILGSAPDVRKPTGEDFRGKISMFTFVILVSILGCLLCVVPGKKVATATEKSIKFIK